MRIWYGLAALVFLSGVMVYPLRAWGWGVYGPWPAFAHAFAFAALWTVPSAGRLRVGEAAGLFLVIALFEVSQMPGVAPMLRDVPVLGPYAAFGTFSIWDLAMTAAGIGLWPVLTCLTPEPVAEQS